jgi:hypothetical protein
MSTKRIDASFLLNLAREIELVAPLACELDGRPASEGIWVCLGSPGLGPTNVCRAGCPCGTDDEKYVEFLRLGTSWLLGQPPNMLALGSDGDPAHCGGGIRTLSDDVIFVAGPTTGELAVAIASLIASRLRHIDQVRWCAIREAGDGNRYMRGFGELGLP